MMDRRASVPAHWRWAPLGDLVTDGPSNGYSGPTSSDSIGTPTLRLSATSQGYMLLNEQTTKRLEETIDSESRYWLRSGDLLIQRSNTIDLVGTAAIYEGEDQVYIYPDLMTRVCFENPETTRYVWRYLNSPNARLFYQAMAAGSSGSMPKLSGAKLRKMPIPLPPLAEQRRIADILDQADALRRKQREALALMDELLRSTFLEMFGDPVTNPKGWETIHLGSLIIDGPRNGLYRPADDYGSGVPIVRIDSFYSGNLTNIRDLKRVRIDAEITSRFSVENGDILINRVNSPKFLGKSVLVNGLSEPTVFESNMMKLLLDTKRCSSRFVVSQMQDQWIRGQIATMSRDAVNQSSINQQDVKSIQLRLPPVQLQRRFESFVDLAYGVGERLSAQYSATDTLFEALTQRAFKGEL